MMPGPWDRRARREDVADHLCEALGRTVARRDRLQGGVHMIAIQAVEEKHLRKDLPPFKPGDTIKVQVKVVEGDKERLQAFEGICIRRRGTGLSATFTVRKVTYGVGVERTFPSHSPSIDRVEILRQGLVRRAKLYYLRKLRGKAARIKERRVS